MDVANHPQPDESRLTPFITEDFHTENVVTAVTDKTYHGAAGCLVWLRDITDAFAEGWRFDFERVIADGHSFVGALLAFIATGATSGAPMHLRWIGVAWFRDGKINRIAGYAHRAEALKAVGWSRT
jgi:ketosteroid isomerase-like protein